MTQYPELRVLTSTLLSSVALALTFLLRSYELFDAFAARGPNGMHRKEGSSALNAGSINFTPKINIDHR